MSTQARESAGNSTADRQGFIDYLAKRLRSFERDIEQLQRHAAEVRERGKEAVDQSVIGLEKRRGEIQRMLGDMQSAGKEAWIEARPKLERAVTNLSDALEAAKKHLN